MAKIFINYRRGDDPSAAQALFGRLEQAFGPEQLFMDVDSIEPGLDFVRVLNDQVAQCDVLISIIGRNWVDACDERGARRLDNPDDFVRIEIETALQQDKRVIPVLVGQAQMPSADQLPDTMKPFARRNAVRLTHERFRTDTQALITALQRALKSAEDEGQREQAKAPAEEEARQTVAEERRREVGAERQSGVERERAGAQPPLEEAGAKRLADEKEHRKSPRPSSRLAFLIGSLVCVLLLGAIGAWFAVAHITVTPLSLAQEQTLKPKDTFRECSQCPQMIVVPAGHFTMGSPANEPGRTDNDGPQHQVTIAQTFAVGQFDVTRDEFSAFVHDTGYDAGSSCYVLSGKEYTEKDGLSWHNPGFGQTGSDPVVCIDWSTAQTYVDWLRKKIGKDYRLLSESEWEYSARAGTTTAYYWGDALGINNADCGGCGSHWDSKSTAPVGSFAANAFGLYDMAGNVKQWVADCWNDNYSGAPADGSAWSGGDCIVRVHRGGGWYNSPTELRSASRFRTNVRIYDSGFRVGRTLLTR
jgi:formylglycine-generating enzyme required for sulfatase activity